MKIHFERTGGFMGLRMVTTIDTDDLPEEEAEVLCRLFDDVDFFELPARLDSPDPAMDQFHYVLSVSREEIPPPREVRSFWNRFDDDEDDEAHDDRNFAEREDAPVSAGGEETHTVTFTDAAAPSEMQPLIRMLTRMAHGE